MISNIKKTFSILWQIKTWLLVSILVLMGVEVVVSYSASGMMGIADAYNFKALGDELSIISNNNPDYIYKTIVDDGIIVYLLAVCTTAIAMIYWLNIFLIKLGLHAVTKSEVWVEDAFPSQKEMMKGVGNLMFVCGATLLVFFIMSFIVIQLSTSYEAILIGNIVVGVIILWSFISMYMGTTFMLKQGCGIIESIKNSMMIVNRNKIGLIMISLVITPMIILTNQWIVLFMIVTVINTISVAYVSDALNVLDNKVEQQAEEDVVNTSN